MAIIKCPECGKEISDKAKRCVHCGYELVEEKPTKKFCCECGAENLINAKECVACGYPFEKEGVLKKIKSKSPKNQAIIMIIVVAIIVVIGSVLYNVIIVRPKNMYNHATELLEKGKYEEADKILVSIKNYKDVSTIREQLKYESYTYAVINDLKKYLKNPDSVKVHDVTFYDSKGDETEEILDTDEVASNYPICIMRYGAQNGFGGNTTGYVLGYYDTDDEEYEIWGFCDSLNEDDIDEDDYYERVTCETINAIIEDGDKVGDVDMERIKAVIKNDAYSTIKIIE